MGKAAVVWISVPGEIDPGIADLGRECSWAEAAARHRSAAIRIVEDECDLAAVKCARPAVEHRRLPREPIIESRGRTLRRFAFRLGYAALPDGRR